MPVVKPISDLQRNLGSIARTCHDSREPVYLTKNGSASLVLMDAEEFDRRQRALSVVSEREERVQRAITRDYDDMLNGRTRPWAQARQDADRIRAARGDAQALRRGLLARFAVVGEFAREAPPEGRRRRALLGIGRGFFSVLAHDGGELGAQLRALLDGADGQAVEMDRRQEPRGSLKHGIVR